MQKTESPNKENFFSKYIILFLTITLIVISFVFLFFGRYSVEPGQVIKILWANLTGTVIDSIQNTVVWKVRLPRILLAALVGGGLSVSGAAFQGCFHNPLVSPDVLGVSAGAGFGAALGILLTTGVTSLTLALALGFGITSVLLSWSLSRIKNESNVLSLVLSGMVVSAVFSAMVSLVKLVADTDSELPAITFWLMGSFAGATYKNLSMVCIPISIGIATLIGLRWRINVLTLGDDEARSLGVNPGRMRLIIIAASTAITAFAVMVTGIIGWVGLIMPNLCRMFVGADNERLIPVVGLSGAIFMLVVDFLARSMTAAEIPIGILTAIVGAPFFFVVYKRSDLH